MKVRRIAYFVLGCLGLVLGTAGVLVPVLPTVPFYLLAAFAFARSSKRLHTRFTQTELYQKNLANYVAGKGMTWAAKIRILATVTVLMTLGVILMLRKALYLPCVILGAVWVLHVIYFLFFVKTGTEAEE